MLLHFLCAGVALHTEATCVMKGLEDFAALQKAVDFHITHMSKDGRFWECP